VDADLEPRLVGPPHLRLQILWRHHPEPDVVGAPFVGPPHPGRLAADRAVRKELGRANPQPRVAEAGPDPEADQRVQRLVEHHHQVRADRQLPPLGQPLVGAQLGRVPDPGLDRRGDAVRQEVAATREQPGHHLLFGRRRHDGADGAERGLPEDAGRLPRRVAVEEPAVRVRRLAGDAGQRQRGRVGDADVVAHPDQDDGVVRRDGVEVGPRRVASLGQAGVVVAAAEDPAPLRLSRCRLRHQADQVADLPVLLGREVEVEQGEADRHRVGVGVVQARGRGPASEVDRRRARRHSGTSLHVGADAAMRPKRMATAVASGRAGSIVRTRPLTSSRFPAGMERGPLRQAIGPSQGVYGGAQALEPPYQATTLVGRT
jgi:hypothetical protein